MEDITLHLANENDIQTLIDYRVEFLKLVFGEPSEEAIAELKKTLLVYFKKELGQNYLSYIAKSGDTIAGMGGMIVREQPGNFKNPLGKMGYFVNMYTLPAFRKKGVCSAILKALINDATANGIGVFELHATQEGERVYIKEGFKLHDEPTYRLLI